jgi:Dyp-type peroxidase family
MLCLRFADVGAAKAWIRALEPNVATTAEVLAFADLRRAVRARRGRSIVGATWVNVAFSAPGLAKLTSPEEVAAFPSVSFRLGAAADARELGDPVDEHGRPVAWRFGGDGEVPDAFLIVASDDEQHLTEEVMAQKAALEAPGAPEVTCELQGRARRDAPGHEHFGFKDGVSQPAVRGRVGDGYLAPRRLPPETDAGKVYAAPGRPLVWPGQFVIGLPLQNGDDPLEPVDAPEPAPAWARNGSYLVVRQLRQDVGGFWRFVREQADALRGEPGFEATTPERLASLMVGRWPSGAPLVRAPERDLEELGGDDCANNSFFFHGPFEPTAVEGCPPDEHPPARADPDGAVCPYAAHIRKVNPRDDGTDTGGLPDVFTHAVLRRGIAYGTPFREGEEPDGTERGLLFLCYQSSIKNQFKFLVQRWANQPGLPHGEHGHDPIIGQVAGPERKRWLSITGENGRERRIELPDDFVVPTGAAYLFAPSLSALRDPLGKESSGEA